jgi:hypothetical protein
MLVPTYMRIHDDEHKPSRQQARASTRRRMDALTAILPGAATRRDAAMAAIRRLAYSKYAFLYACVSSCVCVCVFVCSRVCACAYAYQRHQDVMRYLFCSRQSAMAACILKLTGVHFARAQLYTNPHEVEDPNPHGSAENIVIFKVPFMCLRRHTGVRCANALVIRLAFANILRHICNRGYIM